MKPMGQWNVGQLQKPNGCCTEAAYHWCLEHNYIKKNTLCQHPLRDLKTCAEIHGDDEIEELMLKEMNEGNCGI